MNYPFRFFSSLIIFLLVISFLAACTIPGLDASFFNGKTITILVPNGKGGGVDTYARTITPFLQKYLPGSKFEVINNTDNGGLTAKNDVYKAKPDGLILGFTVVSSALLAEWAGVEGVEYKTKDFSIIGSFKSDDSLMVASPKSGLATMQDFIQAKKVSMGFTSVVTNDYFIALSTAKMFGYEVDAHTEFTSSNDAGLACVRGDVDAILLSYSSLSSQIEEKTLIPVVSFTRSRLDALPETPTIFEVIPEDGQDVMDVFVKIYILDRALIAPPNISANRLRTLRQALDLASSDPEFLAAMDALNRPVNYVDGETFTNLRNEIYKSENQIRTYILDLK